MQTAPNHWERKMKGIENYPYIGYSLFDDMWIGGEDYKLDSDSKVYLRRWSKNAKKKMRPPKYYDWIVSSTLYQKAYFMDDNGDFQLYYKPVRIFFFDEAWWINRLQTEPESLLEKLLRLQSRNMERKNLCSKKPSSLAFRL